MSSLLSKYGYSLQARWRWSRGRCPVCNRKLYAILPYHMASHPHCFCQGETLADSRFWNKYQDTLLEESSQGRAAIQKEGAVIAEKKRKDERAEVVRWEGEGGQVSGIPEATIQR